MGRCWRIRIRIGNRAVGLHTRTKLNREYLVPMLRLAHSRSHVLAPTPERPGELVSGLARVASVRNRRGTRTRMVNFAGPDIP